MRPASVLALIWVASCSGADTDLPRATPDAGAETSSSSSGSGGAPPQDDDSAVRVHAAFDLPREARTRTLSALTGRGPELFALPDKSRRIITLTANAEYTEFTVGDGFELTGLTHPTWDGEGLARAADGSFYVVADETAPHVIHVSAEGAQLDVVEIPERFADQASNNKGLESLALAPSGTFLFSCNESALTSDGPAASKTQGTVVRILRLPIGGGAAREYAYRTEPLGAGSRGDMGVSDVTALGDDSLLVLERGYQSDYGNTVRLFRVSLAGATDVAALDSLGDAPPVVDKELIVDLATLPPGDVQHPAKQPNPLLDNYEAITVGPTLPDGRASVILLSDDNAQASQVARVLVLSLRSL